MHSLNKPVAVVYAPYPPSSPGASGMRVHYFARALEEEGFSVHMLSPRDASGVGLALKITALHPRLVIATSPPLVPTFYTWMGARLSGAKWVLDAKEDGHALRMLSKKHRSMKEEVFLSLRGFLYEHADRIWFLTHADKEEANQKYSLSPSRMELVPNGVDARITFDSAARARVRKEWKVSPETRVVVYAGSVGDEDLMGLLDAFPSSKKLFLALILAHDSSVQDTLRVEEIKNRIQEKGLEEKTKIEINIPVEHMSRVLSASDVGVIPWRNELPTSIPVKVFDYAGTGLPVLAKCPAHGELDLFLKQHSRVGASVSSWETFSTHLAKFARTKTLTLVERKKKALEAHTQWSRSRISKGAISSLMNGMRHPY